MVYRAALIGCGKIASEFADDPGFAASGICTHAQAYAACEHTELVAICDSDAAKLERCGRRWNVAARYRDARSLLEEQHPEIVSICTPDPSHYELVRTVLLMSSVRAVLAEKPLALELGQARELVHLASQRGVVLAVNYLRRYAKRIVELRESLHQGHLGTVRLALGLYTKGTLHSGTHWLDLARYLLGEVVRVTGRNRLQEKGDDPTLDIHLDFEGGAAAELLGCSEDDFSVFEMDLIGTRGRVRLTQSGDVVDVFTVVQDVPSVGYRGLVRQNRTESVLRDALLNVGDDLVRCLRGSAAPRCSGVDAVRALEIGLAAQRSAVTGKPVELGGPER
jgi:predicted dehydrogenase